MVGVQKREIHKINGWRWVLMWLAALLIKLWSRTLRFEEDPHADKDLMAHLPKPAIILIWHNRLFIGPEIYRRYGKNRTLAGLVSASKDGAWLAAFFNCLGFKAIRGSSSWRGAQAMREIYATLAAGHDLAITPDGPRGPRYRIKPSVARLVAQAGVPVIFFKAQFKNAWKLASWDGFYIPKPFSIVHVSCEYTHANGDTQYNNPSSALELCEQKLRATCSAEELIGY